MTVIAWDGRTVAADSQSSANGLTSDTVKIRRFESDRGTGVLAEYGTLSCSAVVRAWFLSDLDADEFPSRHGAEDGRLVVFYDDGTIHEYEGTPFPLEVATTPSAWGCGADLAVGAMEHGATAAEAVEIACRRQSDCGGPVVTLEPGNG